ncbi:MAG: thioredoxin fold domain-containing protein [Bacteroidia bacterium]|nr:thioredoxin fold domain-containing protein [Bacteroidia bacterium]MDW8235305.1 thioredoxin fold domain-containing protein [Bacteroidia bacterium]
MRTGWILLSVGWLLGQQAGIKFFQGNWQSLLEEARKTGRPFFTDFYTDWCGPCRLLESRTFSNPEVAEYVEKHFLAYRLDAERGEGRELASKLKVRAYPTIIFFNSQGVEIGKWVGFIDAPRFLSLLQKYYQQAKGDKGEILTPSWENFQKAHRAIFYDLTREAWEKGFIQRFMAWQQGDAPPTTEEKISPIGEETLRALELWRSGQKEAALHTLHRRLYQENKLTPMQAHWLASYALLYWEPLPPETIQWITYRTKKDPSGYAFLTQAALHYKLGRIPEAKSALKEARLDLAEEDASLAILSALLSQP